jgi:hypothetical protein
VIKTTLRGIIAESKKLRNRINGYLQACEHDYLTKQEHRTVMEWIGELVDLEVKAALLSASAATAERELTNLRNAYYAYDTRCLVEFGARLGDIKHGGRTGDEQALLLRCVRNVLGISHAAPGGAQEPAE